MTGIETAAANQNFRINIRYRRSDAARSVSESIAPASSTRIVVLPAVGAGEVASVAGEGDIPPADECWALPTPPYRIGSARKDALQCSEQNRRSGYSRRARDPLSTVIPQTGSRMSEPLTLLLSALMSSPYAFQPTGMSGPKIRNMKIGELSKRTGVTTKTIRYYEEIGLLPPPDRADNGYREFAEEAVERLGFIRDAQASGLSLGEIASILDLRGHGQATCEHVIDLLVRHLEALDRHITGLRQTRQHLAALTDRARSLDPADCRDPNRCQTIGLLAPTVGGVSGGGQHLHAAPTGHSH